MPAKHVAVNLLSPDDLTRTSHGRLITWTLTYGRYIMIITEVVVLIAFLARFSLDRTLSDLREEIIQKQAILEANASFERELGLLDKRLTLLKPLVDNQNQPLTLLERMQSTLPVDVHLTEFHLTKDSLLLTAIAGTNHGFSQFIANLQFINTVTNIEIENVNKNALTGIEFRVKANVKT